MPSRFGTCIAISGATLRSRRRPLSTLAHFHDALALRSCVLNRAGQRNRSECSFCAEASAEDQQAKLIPRSTQAVLAAKHMKTSPTLAFAAAVLSTSDATSPMDSQITLSGARP